MIPRNFWPQTAKSAIGQQISLHSKLLLTLVRTQETQPLAIARMRLVTAQKLFVYSSSVAKSFLYGDGHGRL
jgi:hypothetical protein